MNIVIEEMSDAPYEFRVRPRRQVSPRTLKLLSPMFEARATVTTPLPPERAFTRFTTELGAWWPPEYTWSQQALQEIGMEPGEGGLCFERGPGGFRLDWGRVLAWQPPERVVFSWHISPDRVPQPDPSQASEVDVAFAPVGEGTRVELVHRAFERHGEGARDYAAAMGSPQGWEYILGRFAG